MSRKSGSSSSNPKIRALAPVKRASPSRAVPSVWLRRQRLNEVRYQLTRQEPLYEEVAVSVEKEPLIGCRVAFLGAHSQSLKYYRFDGTQISIKPRMSERTRSP